MNPTHDPIEATILLVDDEPQILRVISARLRRSFPRVEVLSAQSAFEGMRLLDTHHVDLVISDHRMPGIDGVRFLTHAERRAKSVPRIMLTGYADAEIAVRAVNEGHVSAFFQKPAVSEEFERIIDRLLSARVAALERDRAFAAAEAMAASRIPPDRAKGVRP